MAEAPVFIGGLSYSGKTQMRQMLEAHPDLCLVRRTKLWRHFGEFGDLRREGNRALAKSVLSAEHSTGPLWPDWEKVFMEFDEGAFTYARLFGIVVRQHAESGGHARWGEQYGGIIRFAEDIFATYPEARMIHMIRRPAARLSRMAGAGRRPGWVGRETAAFIDSVLTARNGAKTRPERYKVLSYEELSEDPRGVLESVCDFIGVAAEPIMRSGVIDGIRFDDQDTLLAGASRSIREFPEALNGYWADAEGVDGPRPGFELSTLARFPLNSLALLYEMHSPKWGRRE